MQVKVVERDFTLNGKMKLIPQKERRDLDGYLPFFSVDTLEEAHALIDLALCRGEFVKGQDGHLYEATLMEEQTIDNLRLAGDRLAALHEELQSAHG